MNLHVDVDLQDGAGTDAALNAQLAELRSRVETELGKPAVVLVTSALLGDGKALTAHSLANSFTKSGRRTALVTLTADGAEHERLAAFVKGMRSNYDFTIVDAGAFLKSNTAMALVPLVDGILLTVRLGRAPTDEDELIVTTIEHAGGRILGVVATTAEAVAEFERVRERIAHPRALPTRTAPMPERLPVPSPTRFERDFRPMESVVPVDYAIASLTEDGVVVLRLAVAFALLSGLLMLSRALAKQDDPTRRHVSRTGLEKHR